MKFDYLKLANIIKTRRNDKGISTRKLAEKIGISHAEISRFENGLKPSFYLIPFVKMCEELELGIEDLLIEVGLLSEIEDKKYDVVDLWLEIKKSSNITYSKFLQILIYLDIIGAINYNKKGEIYNENTTS